MLKPDCIVKVDTIHRFVIPHQIIRKLNINGGDELEVFCDDKQIVLFSAL